ncbi:MAG: CPBP family intramembrane metalloprotease [Bacillota bacterium]|nr:CPBP family intramembrane metalloprotease [Bacillota bacterium]
MNNVVIFIFIFVAAIFVKIAANILKFDNYSIELKNPRQNGLIGLAVILIIEVIDICNCSYTSKHIMGLEYTIIAALQELLPVILVLYFQHDTIESIGLTSKNLLRSFFLSLSLIALLLVTVHFFIIPNGMYYPVSKKISLLINYLIVGFYEEIAFRGFLQTRLIAGWGQLKRVGLTAIICALIHIPSRLIYQQGINNAIISSLALIPCALLFGYIMLKAKNIVAPAIFHAGFDWLDIVIIY